MNYKFRITYLLGVTLLLCINFSNNPPVGHSGAPGDSLCTACHATGNPSNFIGNITISGLPVSIAPNTTYPITVTVAETNPAASPFQAGFQLVALDGSNNGVGTVSNLGSNVNALPSGNRTYVEHSPAQVFGGTDMVSWTFDWVAPAGPNNEAITFYAASVIANGIGGNLGDLVISNNVSGTLQVPVGALSVQPQVFLSGPYDENTGMMHDSLRTQGLIPDKEPYSSLSNFTHVGNGGGEQITDLNILTVSGANAIVDWGFFELRSATDATIVIETRSGLIQRDGDVVGVDGVSPLTFSSPNGNYYVSVRHRNHLGVMTISPVALSGTTTFLDFRDPLVLNGVENWGTIAQRKLGNVRALWNGNANGDNLVKFEGGNNDKDVVGVVVITDAHNTSFASNFIVEGYFSSDVNLDGVIKFNGGNNDKDNLGTAVILHPGNTGFASNFVVTEQLPE